ncbi:MAG: AsmA-like C-terminal region-containing protein, partial [Bacteroidota bacterium]
GSFNKKTQVLDLSLKGNNLDVKNTRLYLPWQIREKLEALPVNEGKLDFYARLNGPVKNGRPEFKADFNLSRGEMLLNIKEQPLRLKNISVKGYLSNGRYNSPESSLLTLNDLHAEWNESELNCNLEIADFKHPQLSVEGSALLNLVNSSDYFTNTALENSGGTVYLNYELNDDMEDMDQPAHLIRSGRLTGDATFNDFTMNKDRFNIALESGFAYLDRDLYLDSLQASFNGNNMVINGTIHEIYENLTDTSKPYRFDLSMESKAINMDRFFVKRSHPDDSLLNFQFPRKMDGNIDFTAGWFQWNRFNASKMRGRVAISEGLIEMNRLRFKAFQGQTYADATFKDTGKDSYYLLDSRLYMDNINIHNVFNTFRDFGQDYITRENINGFINGEVKLESELDKHLKFNKNSLYILSDFEINDGELIDFEPLIQMSNFVNLSEIKHVTFSQLSNEITIEDRTIYIPEMDIHSSAFDISVSGYHSFDNDFSYQVNLLLSQVLSKRARQQNDFRTEFGNIQDDEVGRTKLFLKIHGTPEKYAIQYDKEGVKNKIREDLKKEKKELKAILNEEFGWFSKDSVMHSKESNDEGGGFGISWEEDSGDNPERENQGGEPSNQSEEEFVIEWEEDTIK